MIYNIYVKNNKNIHILYIINSNIFDKYFLP